MWLDPQRIIIKAKIKDTEQRMAIIAQHAGKYWTGIYTIRDASVRIISIRRARTSEEVLYAGVH